MTCGVNGGAQFGYKDFDCSEESRANKSSAAFPLDECKFYRQEQGTEIFFTMDECYKGESVAESSLCDNDNYANIVTE